ncbi:hypothetical protein [Diaphorobacter sp.]|uniref:hypothetical protein n=1 Tax=Diaphorobacter sp. TaxID=1934310 RepID=UPI00289B8A1A|nr:hypothetical protein [Diaphorobacter sp.]
MDFKAAFQTVKRLMDVYKIWGILALLIPSAMSVWTVVEALSLEWGRPTVALIGIVAFTQAALFVAAIRYLFNFTTSVRLKDDLTFGLSFHSVVFAYRGPDDPQAALQLGLLLQNSAHSPIVFRVERFSVVVKERTVSRDEWEKTETVIPRGSFRTFRDLPMGAEVVNDVGLGVHEGRLLADIVYGKYGEPMTRRYKLRLKLTLHLGGNGSASGVADLIESEADSAI